MRNLDDIVARVNEDYGRRRAICEESGATWGTIGFSQRRKADYIDAIQFFLSIGRFEHVPPFLNGLNLEFPSAFYTRSVCDRIYDHYAANKALAYKGGLLLQRVGAFGSARKLNQKSIDYEFKESGKGGWAYELSIRGSLFPAACSSLQDFTIYVQDANNEAYSLLSEYYAHDDIWRPEHYIALIRDLISAKRVSRLPCLLNALDSAWGTHHHLRKEVSYEIYKQSFNRGGYVFEEGFLLQEIGNYKLAQLLFKKSVNYWRTKFQYCYGYSEPRMDFAREIAIAGGLHIPRRISSKFYQDRRRIDHYGGYPLLLHVANAWVHMRSFREFITDDISI